MRPCEVWHVGDTIWYRRREDAITFYLPAEIPDSAGRAIAFMASYEEGRDPMYIVMRCFFGDRASMFERHCPHDSV